MATSELKVEVHDGIGLCAVGNTLVVVHPSDARRERARFFHDRLEQLALQVGGDVACMLIIPDTADPPDTETRLEHARRFARHAALRRFVTVSIGDEFWHKVVQGITHGMNQAHGRGCVFVSTKSISEGIAALFEPVSWTRNLACATRERSRRRGVPTARCRARAPGGPLRNARGLTGPTRLAVTPRISGPFPGPFAVDARLPAGRFAGVQGV